MPACAGETAFSIASPSRTGHHGRRPRCRFLRHPRCVSGAGCRGHDLPFRRHRFGTRDPFRGRRQPQRGANLPPPVLRSLAWRSIATFQWEALPPVVSGEGSRCNGCHEFAGGIPRGGRHYRPDAGVRCRSYGGRRGFLEDPATGILDADAFRVPAPDTGRLFASSVPLSSTGAGDADEELPTRLAWPPGGARTAWSDALPETACARADWCHGDGTLRHCRTPPPRDAGAAGQLPTAASGASKNCHTTTGNTITPFRRRK